MKQKEEQNQLIKMKTELIKKEYQDNLKEVMEQRMFDLAYKLKHIEEGGNLSVIELKSLLSQKNIVGLSPKYSTVELAILFDYYKQFIEMINKKQKYLPTKKDFCSFIGISSTQYNNWQQSDDNERREIMQMIDDYITDLQLTLAQNREVDNVTTIYRTKAEHGMFEAQAPQIVKHEMEKDIKQILANVDAINAGKSLKTIESVKGEDGVYRSKED